MAVKDIYKSYLYNEFLKTKAKQGLSVTTDEVEAFLRDNVDPFDLSIPQFDSKYYKVEKKENASASKMNETIAALKQDLVIMYKVFLAYGQGTTEDFERWKREIEVLEKRLIDLEDRIENLLLIAQDTEGYHSFFLDNLTDLFHTDLTNTTVAVDIASQSAFLSPYLAGAQTTTKIDLGIDQDGDDRVSFRVRTSNAVISDSDGTKELPLDGNTNTPWWIEVKSSSPEAKEVVVEYTVQLSVDPVYISSIWLYPHGSGGFSVTPLTSLDGYTYSQLKSSSPTKNVLAMTSFDFRGTSTKWVKFLLVRPAPTEPTDGGYRYEFGFSEIEFRNEVFTPGESKSFISRPISITNPDDTIREFSKVTLEVCEDVPDNTSIDYFVTPGSTSDFSISGTTKWYPISPIDRADPQHPQVLNLGDIAEVEIGDAENVTISSELRATNTDYKNPAQIFRLLSLGADDSVLNEEVTSSSVRFVPAGINERILNYQIKDSDYSGSGTGNGLSIEEDDIKLFRNVGEKGLTADNTVRGIQRGWRWESPYYITLVEILEDTLMDFGDEEIIVDNKRWTGPQILLGKTTTFDGIHEIRVHKNNWKHVTPELNTLTELIAADPLYPYNHKLLIEGYNYGSSWLGDINKIYQGADLFFERRAKKINLFDLSENLEFEDRYRYFALDRDIADTHTGGNSSTRVFVVKVDNTNPDFENEKFNIRFNLVSQRYSYLRFRADLLTDDELNCPVMGPYKLKFAD